MSSRYKFDNQIDFGNQLGTAYSVSLIRTNIKAGNIRVMKTIIATGADRLDALAGALYGDARYWWVLAAASDIGWGLQIPPGTVINVLDLNEVERFIG